MSSMLLIVPSRKRPESCDQLLEEFKKTSKISEIIFGLDDDDESHYSDEVLARAEKNPRLRMGGTLNLIAARNADKYDYLAFMGDDHRPRTAGWDRTLSEAIGPDAGVAYGNDLLQGNLLPTAVVMSSSIVKKIGYMVPPVLVHMYMDNFWLELGKSLGNLRYREDIIIEHMHHLNGKSKPDATYMETNNASMYAIDSESFHRYMTTQFSNDIRKILGL